MRPFNQAAKTMVLAGVAKQNLDDSSSDEDTTAQDNWMKSWEDFHDKHVLGFTEKELEDKRVEEETARADKAETKAETTEENNAELQDSRDDVPDDSASTSTPAPAKQGSDEKKQGETVVEELTDEADNKKETVTEKPMEQETASKQEKSDKAAPAGLGDLEVDDSPLVAKEKEGKKMRKFGLFRLSGRSTSQPRGRQSDGDSSSNRTRTMSQPRGRQSSETRIKERAISQPRGRQSRAKSQPRGRQSRAKSQTRFGRQSRESKANGKPPLPVTPTPAPAKEDAKKELETSAEPQQVSDDSLTKDQEQGSATDKDVPQEKQEVDEKESKTVEESAVAEPTAGSMISEELLLMAACPGDMMQEFGENLMPKKEEESAPEQDDIVDKSPDETVQKEPQEEPSVPATTNDTPQEEEHDTMQEELLLLAGCPGDMMQEFRENLLPETANSREEGVETTLPKETASSEEKVPETQEEESTPPKAEEPAQQADQEPSFITQELMLLAACPADMAGEFHQNLIAGNIDEEPEKEDGKDEEKKEEEEQATPEDAEPEIESLESDDKTIRTENTKTSKVARKYPPKKIARGKRVWPWQRKKRQALFLEQSKKEEEEASEPLLDEDSEMSTRIDDSALVEPPKKEMEELVVEVPVKKEEPTKKASEEPAKEMASLASSQHKVSLLDRCDTDLEGAPTADDADTVSLSNNKATTVMEPHPEEVEEAETEDGLYGCGAMEKLVEGRDEDCKPMTVEGAAEITL